MSGYDDLNKRLTSAGIVHFNAQELCLVHSLNVRNLPPRKLWTRVLPTLGFLEFLRLEFGPLRVVSGYRNKTNNRKVGGAKNSQHVQFRAVDFYPTKGRLREVKARCLEFYEGTADGAEIEDFFWHQFAGCRKSALVYLHTMGLGFYNSFIHVDLGYKKRKW